MIPLVLDTELANFNDRRGGIGTNERWKPRAGDIIVSNWASWIDVLWLSIRFVSSAASHD